LVDGVKSGSKRAGIVPKGLLMRSLCQSSRAA